MVPRGFPLPDQWEADKAEGEYTRRRVYWDGEDQVRLGESVVNVYYFCENTTGRGWRSAENAHNHHELLYTLEGESRYRIDGRDYTFKAGQFCFIPRHTRHYAWLDEGVERTRVFVVVLDFTLAHDPEVFLERLDSLPVAAPLYQYFFLDRNRLLECHERFRPQLEALSRHLSDDATADGPDLDLVVRTSLMQILLYASRASREAAGGPIDGKHDAAWTRRVLCLERARQFIQARFTEPFPMEEAAEQAYMSRYHFIRQFKQVFGVTPSGYRIDLRIREAKRLLALTDMPVSTVAYRLGYQNPEHFSRYFSRRVGVSPSEYSRAALTRGET